MEFLRIGYDYSGVILTDASLNACFYRYNLHSFLIETWTLVFQTEICG